jgi:hypothetical protein
MKKAIVVSARQVCRSGMLSAIGILVWMSPFGQARAADYNTNLADIKASVMFLHTAVGCHKPTPIGDLGAIETVVDLRGFVPMAFQSRSPYWMSARTDSSGMQWYRVPTPPALLMLYFGDINSDHIADDASSLTDQRFVNTKFLKESEAQGESLTWGKVAYAMTTNAAPMFKKYAGGDYDSFEPTTVFLTEQSAFVVVNFRYSNLNVRDKGQLLMAIEFSRSLKECKAVYRLYDTVLISPSAMKDLKDAGSLGIDLTSMAVEVFAQ